MQQSNLQKAALLVLVLTLLSVGSWEIYLRSRGYPISYNNDAAQWSTKRKLVYQPASEATVFIGASRIKFDLDLATWERITGDKPIQLSMVATSPRPFLEDLANDNNFKGKLIIDVTEGSLFNRNTKRTEKSSSEFVAYYKKWTPAQKFSTYVNYPLESGFVFLESNKFSLNALLDDIPITDRKGVTKPRVFPRGFGMNSADRQSFMDEEFLRDTTQQKTQQENWRKGSFDRTAAMKGDTLETIFKQIKRDVDKIRARGGKVIFVRTPSNGAYRQMEREVYPRQKYWDALLTYTNTPGIHFEDYPETAHMTCPEWSHLSPADAIVYTKAFIKILTEDKGWSFPHMRSPQ